MAIMPGTSTQAELPFGFIWQEGTSLPEVLLTTTEDIMAGDQSVIVAGTQFLGQAQVDPSSGAVSIRVVGIFGEISKYSDSSHQHSGSSRRREYSNGKSQRRCLRVLLAPT